MAKRGRRGSLGGRVARRGAAAIAASLAALLAAELILRVARPFPVEAPLYPGDVEPDVVSTERSVVDPAVGWRFAPWVEIEDATPEYAVRYRCGALGFRRNEPFDTLEAERRVVFVGDSFTFGAGVEEDETFVACVSLELARARVVNLGMSGFGVDQFRCALDAYGLPERPTLVIAVFVDEDLTRSTTAYRFREGWAAKPTFALVGGELAERTAENAPGALSRWFAQTYLGEIARRVDRKLGREYGLGSRWALNRAIFAALRDDCLAAGARLLVVHLPQRASWRPAPAYAAEFRELATLFLDLGAVSVEDPRELYFPRDPHLNRDGHALVGREIAAFLREQGFAEALLR